MTLRHRLRNFVRRRNQVSLEDVDFVEMMATLNDGLCRVKIVIERTKALLLMSELTRKIRPRTKRRIAGTLRPIINSFETMTKEEMAHVRITLGISDLRNYLNLLDNVLAMSMPDETRELLELNKTDIEDAIEALTNGAKMLQVLERERR